MSSDFIISLDCEGMWGMADRPYDQRSFVTREGLTKIYKDLLKMFAVYEIPTTFAFVGMFVLSDQEREEFEPQLGEMLYRGQDWLTQFRAEREASWFDDWFCPEAFEAVQNDGRHEIGTHGFTHIPFDGPDTPTDLYEREWELVKKLGRKRGVDFKTLIYPRNRVGHVELLPQAGISGYRDLLVQKGPVARVIQEFNIFEKCQPHEPKSAGTQLIPAGYFWNWRHGARAFVPSSVTRLRWKTILKSAAETDGVAHLWSHPHNFISGPSGLDGFEEVLKHAAKLRDQGKMSIKTQEQYIDSLK